MKPLSEVIELIEKGGKAAPADGKLIWQVLWCLARHVVTITPPEQPKPRIYDPLASQKTDALIQSTQIIIDKETARERMRVLNILKAAPGQENRALLGHFLTHKKWIKYEQTPDDWPLAHIPKDGDGLFALAEELDQFKRSQHDGLVEEII